MREQVFEVDGMMCGGCAATVKETVEALAGVAEVAVDLEAKTATVRSTAEVAPAGVIKALEGAGYPTRAR